MKSFEMWTFEEVQQEFGIKKLNNNALLSNWLNVKKEPSQRESETIELLKELLLNYVDTWNEDEIKFHFIAPFLTLINFTTDKYKSFTQRPLHLKTDKVDTSGRVDFMVCTGIQKPQTPFFFFNEYKPSKRGTNDPLGQLLIEMVTAQHLNGNKNPIYGTYTEGRFWYFVVLHTKEYAVSNAYNATNEDIYKILSILCKMKDYIEEMLANDTHT